jgi:hypothetical protein
MVRITIPSIAILIGMAASNAVAQERPAVDDRQFIFSVSTPPSETRHATVYLDSGFGGQAFDVVESQRPEQRLGIQASLGHRLTFLGRIGISSDDRDVQSSQQGELLVSVIESPRQRSSLAVGLGVRHESMGTEVLLGRVAAGRSFSAWRVDGNAVFEKPFSEGRDPVDLITTFGMLRRLSASFSAGVELIGEDLEGFWETAEAEGGARLLVGPSIRFAPSSGRWHVGVAGGPLFHATRSGLASDALRGLPSASSDSSFALRASMSYGF